MHGICNREILYLYAPSSLALFDYRRVNIHLRGLSIAIFDEKVGSSKLSRAIGWELNKLPCWITEMELSYLMPSGKLIQLLKMVIYR